MDTLQQALVNEVKRHARANYDMSGWDVLVECYSDDDILDLIGRARTAKGAIRAAGQIMKRHNEQRAEAVAAGGESMSDGVSPALIDEINEQTRQDEQHTYPDNMDLRQDNLTSADVEWQHKHNAAVHAAKVISHQVGDCRCDGELRCDIARGYSTSTWPSFQREVNAENGE